MNESQSTKMKSKWPVSRWVWFCLGMGVCVTSLLIALLAITRIVVQQRNLSNDARIRIMEDGMSLSFSPFPLRSPMNGDVLNLELWHTKGSLHLEIEIAVVDSLGSKIAADTLHFHSDTLLSDGVILTDTAFYPEQLNTRKLRPLLTIIELRSTDAALEDSLREMPFPSRP